MDNVTIHSHAGPLEINEGPLAMKHNASEEDYKKLIDDIRTVAKTRFRASTRLGFHHKVSQWTIAMSSVVLVMASLLSMDAGTAQALPHAGIIEIVLAVFVLVLSLLIGMDNYPLRADKMHTCALELNDLARRFSVMDQSKYLELANLYNDTLSKFENHGNVDYDIQRYSKAISKIRHDEDETNGITKKYLGKLRTFIIIRYSLSLLPYVAASVVVILSISYFMYKLIKGPEPHASSNVKPSTLMHDTLLIH